MGIFETRRDDLVWIIIGIIAYIIVSIIIKKLKKRNAANDIVHISSTNPVAIQQATPEIIAAIIAAISIILKTEDGFIVRSVRRLPGRNRGWNK